MMMGLPIDSGGRGQATPYFMWRELFKVFTNINWLYVNSFLIRGSEVTVLGIRFRMLGWGVDGAKELTENGVG